jgi:hypothetical protein
MSIIGIANEFNCNIAKIYIKIPIFTRFIINEITYI